MNIEQRLQQIEKNPTQKNLRRGILLLARATNWDKEFTLELSKDTPNKELKRTYLNLKEIYQKYQNKIVTI